MTLTEAHARLRALAAPTFTTNEAATWLRIEGNHASQILGRLGKTRHVLRLGRGRSALPDRLQPFSMPSGRSSAAALLARARKAR